MLLRNFIVVLAVSFLAIVPPPVSADSAPATGPRLTDAEFFARLDLSQPGLSAVRSAVTAADWPAATHALAEYIRHRQSPHWPFEAGPIGHQPTRREIEANKVLKHHFSNIGMDWQFGDNIDWAFNPTTQPDSKWARNNEWTWTLNRHHAWIALARAFDDTGDEKYAREFARELQSWVRDCPVPMDKVANGPFSRWRTIEAGIRTGTIWPEVLPRFLPARSFDDATLVLMLKSFVDHADYLMKFYTRGNWLTMEANGLYHVGAMFPEFKDAKLWRDTAAERLLHELDVQVYPDGAQIELAPGYHAVALNNFLGPVRLEPITGFELPAGYVPKVEKMFSYLLYSMQPGHRMPPLNDSPDSIVMGAFKEAAGLFPQREDFRWGASDGREGLPPVRTSVEFPYAGQFFLRSGWDKDALWLCMDGGPFGFGHQHEDKLSVMVTAFGKPLLVEGGTYTYDGSEWRHYIVSSRAHNVVLVDGLEQNRRKEPADTFVVKTPLPHVWESNATFDHAASRYDEGWGPDAKRIARHTRHVFFIKPDLFIIADQLESLDGQPHHYDALFHLDAPKASVEGLGVATRNSGPTLSLMAWGADSVSIVKGQKEPVVQGWIPDNSRGYGGVKPVPTAIYRTTASGPVTVLYAVYPSAGAASFPVTSAKMAGNQITIRRKGGAEQVIHFQSMPSETSTGR